MDASTTAISAEGRVRSMKEIIVTMPIEEYEHLKEIEKAYRSDCRMFEEAYIQNEAGNGMLTEKLIQRIYEIFC